MKAPKCKLCGAEHYSRQPHVWGSGHAAADKAVAAAQAELAAPARAAKAREAIREAGIVMASELKPAGPRAVETTQKPKQRKAAPAGPKPKKRKAAK